MKISKRAKTIPVSAVRQLAAFEPEVIARGTNVLHLNIGAPDLEVAPIFYESIRNLDLPVLSYAPSQGIKTLIKQVQRYYESMGAYYQEDEIYVTNGGSEAITFALMSVCNPGDQVLIPEPYYSNYQTMASMVEVSFKPIPTDISTGFHLPLEDTIEKLINQDVKAIMLSNPANPTGTVYSKEEILMLARLAKKHGLWVVADEVYREFIYDGFETLSFSVIEDIQDQVIIIDSVSKRFSACGARIGFAITKNKELKDIFMKMCMSRLSVASLSQIGSCALYEHALDFIEQSIPEYKKRRDLICELLEDIPGVLVRKPEGAFYLVATLPVSNADHFCQWLLTDFSVDQTTVMLTPARGFYQNPDKGWSEVRIAYVLNCESISRAMMILKAGLVYYRNNIESTTL